MPAAAQDHALTLHALRVSGLPFAEAPLPHYRSRSAADAAAVLLPAVAGSLAWLNRALGRDDTVTVAVLDAGDYGRYAGRPHPFPFAETLTGLVVMPDTIAAFPGFDRFDMAEDALARQLAVHEMGHLLADRMDIWSRSDWVNELVANVFLAAWLRATHPGERGLLDGPPPRFDHRPPHTSLAQLDLDYATVDPADYAWFQFRIAALADHLVAASADLPALLGALRRAFPRDEMLRSQGRPTPAEALRRLEEIAPGTAALAADLVAPIDLPPAGAVACGPEPPGAEARSMIVIENHGPGDIVVDSRANADFLVRLEHFGDDTMDGEALAAAVEAALADGRYGRLIGPDEWQAFGGSVGSQLYIAGGGCLVFGPEPARYDRSG